MGGCTTRGSQGRAGWDAYFGTRRGIELSAEVGRCADREPERTRLRGATMSTVASPVAGDMRPVRFASHGQSAGAVGDLTPGSVIRAKWSLRRGAERTHCRARKSRRFPDAVTCGVTQRLVPVPLIDPFDRAVSRTCGSRSPIAATSAAPTACRRRAWMAPPDRAAHLRGDRPGRPGLRRAVRVRGDPPHRRRAARAGAHHPADRDARAARRRHRADDQRREAAPRPRTTSSPPG